jgi:hypothetical protein
LDTAAANTAFRGLDFSPITIPEPTTCTLAALGGASLLIFRRRK